MNTLSLLHLFLVLHIIGISLMVGTSVVERFTFGAFRRRLKRGDAASIVLLDHLSRLGVLLGIGAALLVLSGTGMLFLTGGVFVHQGWFKIKLVLVGMLILNGFGFGGRQMARLKKLMQPAVARIPLDTALRETLTKVSLFYVLQLMIYLVIIGLSVANV
jgi:hypothetical protein